MGMREGGKKHGWGWEIFVSVFFLIINILTSPVGKILIKNNKIWFCEIILLSIICLCGKKLNSIFILFLLIKWVLLIGSLDKLLVLFLTHQHCFFFLSFSFHFHSSTFFFSFLFLFSNCKVPLIQNSSLLHKNEYKIHFVCCF